ncbi:MAG TPA: HprK-related kinase A [Gammaproteobacteria bacterium]|nr:HprK-related kinase A [Gammaproteobacteria bacterium]
MIPLDSLAAGEILQRLRSPGGLALRTGSFVVRIHSPMPAVADGVALLYRDFPLAEDGAFADFHVRVYPPAGPRRWWHPQVLFALDQIIPFKPLPASQAFAMLEWGLNWCVSNYAHQFLMLHAAVIARDGRAVILPAPPGSGKSTLCAGLVNRGWRLLSDELTLIDRGTGLITPLPRPVSLKNQSIEVIRAFAPDAVLGPVARDTAKGTVSHMQPPPASVRAADELARPAWIIMPRYQTGAPADLTALPKGEAFIQAADQSFNYSLLGQEGFEAMGRLVEDCECLRFHYGDLEEAVAVFDHLAAS